MIQLIAGINYVAMRYARLKNEPHENFESRYAIPSCRKKNISVVNCTHDISKAVALTINEGNRNNNTMFEANNLLM